jgi:hypothetical protein
MLHGLMSFRNLVVGDEKMVMNLLVSGRRIITRDVDFRGDWQKSWVLLIRNV